MRRSIDGLLVIDKPGGITSRDAVDRAMRWLPKRTPVGHTGTLDPLATGVLVLCIGKATRLAEYVQAMPKSYTSRFRLGSRSDTDDVDGTVTPVPGAVAPSADAVRDAVRSFVGTIEQTPPAYSAAKVSGRRAYAIARGGGDVDLAPRPVTVYDIRITAYSYPYLDVEVDCGKGTYIRSIARDLGAKLGCGGMVETLRRTRVGPFRAEDGVPPDAEADAALAKLRPVEDAVAGLPAWRVDDVGARAVAHGNAVPVAAGRLLREGEGDEAVLLAGDGRLLAIAKQDTVGRVWRPVKVFGA
jgi:tRNA pseudouridine55 synthase